MIQELLGGAGLLVGDRKISIDGSLLESTLSPSLSPSPSPTAKPGTTVTTTSENQNLRCPRCDSSNTKFCYYNNYNLTQPRHFCKTCRRYWTKGGALRNVPIGGGCRKNRSTSNSTLSATSMAKPSSGKIRTFSSEIGRSGSFDHELSSTPILWGSPQNSHILALLRAAQNPNPNPNGVNVKGELDMSGSHLMSDPTVATNTLHARSMGFDPLTSQFNYWRNNQQQNGTLSGDAQNSGFYELYQRLKGSTNGFADHHHHQHDYPAVVLSNGASTSSSLESGTGHVVGGEMGYWNPVLSWSDLPTN